MTQAKNNNEQEFRHGLVIRRVVIGLLLVDSVKFERFIKQLFHSVLGQMNVHQEHVKGADKDCSEMKWVHGIDGCWVSETKVRDVSVPALVMCPC